MYKIRDEKKTHNEVSRPTAVYSYDERGGVLLKIGEYDVMSDYFDDTVDRYRSFGYNEIADQIYLMELPKDQEVIDKVFQITNYIGKLHEDSLKRYN